METQSALLATLRYWRECGIDRLTGEEYGWHQASLLLPSVTSSRLSVPIDPQFTKAPQINLVPEPPKISVDRLLTAPVAPEERSVLFAERASRVAVCQACGLSLTRRRALYGAGALDASLVWVTDAPSEADEQEGAPLSGEVRELFAGMLRALGCKREEVYVTCVVKCRPPADRTPRGDEIRLCQRYWIEEIETIRPKAIVAMGKLAVETLLGAVERLVGARGELHAWRGIPVVVTYHPIYCLRAPLAKRAVWDDLRLLKKLPGQQN
ncbi:MAG: uracil-DNA glycosylase [Magnetococcus sp. YQC-9]